MDCELITWKFRVRSDSRLLPIRRDVVKGFEHCVSKFMFCPIEFRVDDLLSKGLSQNELQQSHSCLTVRGQRIFLDVYTDVILHFLDQAIEPLQ